MSFILDALRKSELERQRDAAARIMRLPVAEREGAHVPVWITALIVVLVISVVVLAGTTWRSWHKRAAGAAVAAAPALPAAAPAPAAAASTAGAGHGTTAAAGAGKQHAAEASARRERKPPDVAAARSSPAAAVKRATHTSPPPVPPTDPAALPSADDLAADGVQVPALTLQLHVYSKNPKQRFVFIDGTRYREGQKTEAGPVLVAVTPKGAVLSQHGREFFVPIQ